MPPLSQTRSATEPPSGPHRPRGITILAVLNGLAASLLLIAASLSLLASGGANFVTEDSLTYDLVKSLYVPLSLAGGGVYKLGYFWIVGFLQGGVHSFCFLSVPFAAVRISLSFGLWKLRYWGRLGALIVSTIDLAVVTVTALFIHWEPSTQILQVVAYASVVGYLLRQRVRIAFVGEV